MSLTYEPGRRAFAARARTVEDLRPLATEVVELPARTEHYAPASRAVLSHLERELFEDDPTPIPPGRGLRLLEAGGERAEVELVAAEVLELPALRRPGRRDRRRRALPAQARAAARHRSSRATASRPPRSGRCGCRTRPWGAGCSRCCAARLHTGTTDDVLAYLRTPGYLRVPALADRLEFEARRAGAVGVDEAAALWEEHREMAARRDRARARGGGRREARAVAEAPRRRGAAPLRAPAPRRGAHARPRRARRRSGPARAAPRARRADRPGGGRPGQRAHGGRSPRSARRARGRARRSGAPGRRAGRQPRPDPCPPLPRGARARPPGGRVPRAPAARALPPRPDPQRGHRGLAAAPSAARGQPRRRALPLLRLRLAPGGDADPQPQHQQRGGHADGPVVLPRRRRAPARRQARGATAAARADHLAGGRGPDRGRARALPGRPPRRASGPSRSSRCATRRCSSRSRTGRSRPARWRRGSPAR